MLLENICSKIKLRRMKIDLVLLDFESMKESEGRKIVN